MLLSIKIEVSLKLGCHQNGIVEQPRYTILSSIAGVGIARVGKLPLKAQLLRKTASAQETHIGLQYLQCHDCTCMLYRIDLKLHVPFCS